MLIRYFDGLVQPAILLAAQEGKMRFVVPGSDDVMEIGWANGGWVSEGGRPVSIEFDPACEVFDQSLCNYRGLLEAFSLLEAVPTSPVARGNAPAYIN